MKKKLSKPGDRIRDFIQDTMLIDDPVSGKMVPFHFRKPQNKYYDELVNDYGSEWWFNDVDEIDVKARKMGFTSMWLAVFASVMLLYKEPRRFLEISYKIDATKQHFRRMRGFLLSPLFKNTKLWNDKLFGVYFDVHTEGSEMVLKENKASFYCGTATSRTGERGGTVYGLLLSEAAHYPDTTIVTANEIIEASRSMIHVGSGIKVIETTANGFNHMRRRWIQATNGEISGRPRFFGWKDFYSPEEFEKIRLGFSDKTMIAQEFPETISEAFLTSGRPVFNSKILKQMEAMVSDIIFRGELVDDEREINFSASDKGELTIWKPPREGRRYMITADIAGGVRDENGLDPLKAANRCWSVGCVWDRSSWEVVAEIRLRCDPGAFGRKLATLGEYYKWALLAPESNNMGAATLEAIKGQGYPHVFRDKDIWPDKQGNLGFPTDERTKLLSLTSLRNAIDGMVYKENSLTAIDEMYEAVFNDAGKLTSTGWLDCVITRMIGLYLLKFFTLDETYRSKDAIDSPIMVTGGQHEHSFGSRFRKRRVA